MKKNHIDIKTKKDELELDDLELDLDTVRIIQEKVKVQLIKNKQHALGALNYSRSLFMKV